MSGVTTDSQRILRDRARALARVPPSTTAPGSMLEVLEFHLAKEHYAVATSYVLEVQPLRELTPIPCTPPFVLGVVNLRGRILPVFDLRRFFDLPEQGITDLHRVIFVKGHEVELGLLADVVVGVHSLAVEQLQPSLPTLTGIRADYLKGVSDRRLVVLDLARVLTDPKILVQDTAEPRTSLDDAARERSRIPRGSEDCP